MPTVIQGTCPKCKGRIDNEFMIGLGANIINIDEPLYIDTAAMIDNWIINCNDCDNEFMLDAGFPIDKFKLKVQSEVV